MLAITAVRTKLLIWVSCIAAGVFLSLTGALWVTFKLYRSAADDAATAQERVASIAAERDGMRKSLKNAQDAFDAEKEETERVNKILAKRERDQAGLMRALEGNMRSLDQLRRNNAQVQSWGDQPIPDPVVEWVRKAPSADGDCC